MVVPPIQLVSPSQVTAAYGSTAGGPAATTFSDMVGDAAQNAMQTMQQAEQVTAAGVAGQTDVQSVVEALSNAEVTMQTVVAVRDKVLGAYNDIMHMSV